MKMLATLSALYLLALSSLVAASGSHGHGEDHHDGDEQEVTGPNGGHLLQEQDVVVEILKTEEDGLASLQAWVTRDDKPVKGLTLSATLARLGGEQEVVTFHQQDTRWMGEQKIQAPHSFDVSLELKLDEWSHPTTALP